MLLPDLNTYAEIDVHVRIQLDWGQIPLIILLRYRVRSVDTNIDGVESRRITHQQSSSRSWTFGSCEVLPSASYGSFRLIDPSSRWLTTVYARSGSGIGILPRRLTVALTARRVLRL